MLTKSLIHRYQAMKMAKPALRRFGAMGQVNKEMFEHSFTGDMTFKSEFEKMKCFRVINEVGEVVTPGYTDLIPEDKLMKIYDAMITMNEADKVFLASQRNGQISFYMTQSGEEASGIGTAAALADQDLIFPQYREAGCFLWRGFSI